MKASACASKKDLLNMLRLQHFAENEECNFRCTRLLEGWKILPRVVWEMQACEGEIFLSKSRRMIEAQKGARVIGWLRVEWPIWWFWIGKWTGEWNVWQEEQWMTGSEKFNDDWWKVGRDIARACQRWCRQPGKWAIWTDLHCFTVIMHPAVFLVLFIAPCLLGSFVTENSDCRYGRPFCHFWTGANVVGTCRVHCGYVREWSWIGDRKLYCSVVNPKHKAEGRDWATTSCRNDADCLANENYSCECAHTTVEGPWCT